MNDLAIMEMIKTNLKNKHATGPWAKCMALKKQKNCNDNKESSSDELDIYGGEAKENGKNCHKGKETDSDEDMDDQQNTPDDNKNHKDDQNYHQHNQNPNPLNDNRNHEDNQNHFQHNQSSNSMDDERNPWDDDRNHEDNQSHCQPNWSPKFMNDEQNSLHDNEDNKPASQNKKHKHHGVQEVERRSSRRKKNWWNKGFFLISHLKPAVVNTSFRHIFLHANRWFFSLWFCLLYALT